MSVCNGGRGLRLAQSTRDGSRYDRSMLWRTLDGDRVDVEDDEDDDGADEADDE